MILSSVLLWLSDISVPGSISSDGSSVTELHSYRREVGTRFASLIFANMRLANLVPTSRRLHSSLSAHGWASAL